MRLFVCSFLSSANQAFYGRQMTALIASTGGILKDIPPESAHITYAFLQHPDERILAGAVDAVTAIASRCGPIRVRLGAPHVLYARAEARLVCAPVLDGGAELSRLAADIVDALGRRLPDVPVSGSRSPHVTLARFRKHIDRRSAGAVSNALQLSADGSSVREDRADAVQVVSSELTSAGPRYAIQASLPLHGPGFAA